MINSMAKASVPRLADWFVTSWMRTALLLLGQIALVVIVSGFVLVERGRTMCDPFFFLPLSTFSAVLVGPILLESFRRNRMQSTITLLRRAVTRAAGAVSLILVLSLVLVNAFFWNGQPLLPSVETFAWAVILTISAASASASALALSLSRISVNAVKWSFRAFAAAVFLIYLEMPPAWPISWYDLVADWGLSLVAFAWTIFFASIASAALILLKRPKQSVQVSE
jgi:hypothetical protein